MTMRDADPTQRAIPPRYTLAALVVETVAFAAAHGVPIDRIITETGVPGPALVDPTGWLPAEVIPTVWRLVAERHPNRPLALHFAATAPLTALGPAPPNARFAADLRQAITVIIEQSAVLSSDLTLTLREAADEATLAFDHTTDALDRGYGAEAGLGLARAALARLTGRPVPLRRVELAHPPNGPEALYVDVFAAPVVFDRAHNALVFDRAALDRPLAAHDPALFAYVRAQLEHTRTQLRAARPADALAPVHAAIEHNAARGEYAADALARTLGMSLRSLQRLAAAHDASVRALLEAAREAAARQLLADDRLSIDEVAEGVGYADRRAFVRAFKRWTGQTPAAFRRG